MGVNRLSAAAFLTLCVVACAMVISTGTAIAASAPAVENEWSVNVNISTAVVEASIHSEGADTTFHVEYGADTSYGFVAPVPDAGVGAAEGSKTVEQQLVDLRPGTVYHYRVVATNESGSTQGPDKTFTTFAQPGASAADSCPNASFRIEASAMLPDCRAYEMVSAAMLSPVEKNGAEVTGDAYKPIAASVSGDRVDFATETGMADTHGSGNAGFTQFLASRGPSGWATKAIYPTPSIEKGIQFVIGATVIFTVSAELDRALVKGYDLPGAPGVSGAPSHVDNLYLEDTTTGRLLEPVARFEGVEEEPVVWYRWDRGVLFGGGTSADLGVTTFQTEYNLTPGAVGTSPKVYALDHGKLRLVSILPDGTVPGEGASLARGQEGILVYHDTVSSDGSRILFLSPAFGSEQQLYMRKKAATTVLVSQSESSEPRVAENVKFQTATPDGTKVVFSTSTRLLDTDPGGTGTALYLYTDSQSPEHESNLTFIARFTGLSEGMKENEVVKGISEDGTHIYFMSEYAESLPFRPGDVGDNGLFLWDKGTIHLVAAAAGLEADNNVGSRGKETIVSKDGRGIAFMNRARGLTANEIVGLGRDNQNFENTEIYVYDEGSEKITCASCPQTGAAVTEGATANVEVTGITNFKYELPRIPRFFSSDGRFVFFNTSEALLPQDTNGMVDAYEYDVHTGRLSLLSTGSGETGTWFAEASPDGRNVFLLTRQSLSPWDPDKQSDIYDARIEGGLPGPPPTRAPCAGDACQGIPSTAPSFLTASEFNGLGNPSFAQVPRTSRRSASRAQRLKRALMACGRLRSEHKRAVCERAARRRYRVKSRVRAGRTGR